MAEIEALMGKKGLLKTIAVDLTPVLPGGENGGAKIFVLQLVRQLAEMAPKTKFVLLTQAASHSELAELDSHNVTRKLIVGSEVIQDNCPRSLRIALGLLAHLPTRRLQRAGSRIAYRLSSALTRRRSGSLLDDIGADLLFCPFTAPTYFHSRIPTVCTIYDLQYKAYPEFFAADDVAHRDRTFVEATRKASRLAAISDFSRDAAIAEGKLDPLRIETVYLRMSQRTLCFDDAAKGVINRLGLAQHRYLIYPANFWKHKNHEMLFTAFGMACRNGLPDDIKLVCTGAPGARQEWLATAALSMGLSSRIVFPGFLPTEEFSVLMAYSGGVVFPSLYEGFGLPVIEAMAAGIPVACSNNTSLIEVAANAAVLFNPRIPSEISEAIVSLVTDDTQRERLVRDGLARAAEFSDSELMAKEYWRLFEKAVSGGVPEISQIDIDESLLTGVYGDGWAGSSLSLQIAPATGAQTVEIEFFVPDWIPKRKLKVEIIQEGASHRSSLHILRGSSATWSATLDSQGGRYELRISPSFVPAQLGNGNDDRELAVMVRRSVIKYSDGQLIELIPSSISI